MTRETQKYIVLGNIAVVLLDKLAKAKVESSEESEKRDTFESPSHNPPIFPFQILPHFRPYA